MRKVFSVITIIVLILGLTLACVACNGNENPNGEETSLPEITLTDTMTVDDVKAELAKVKSFTLIGTDDSAKQMIKVEIDKLARWTQEKDGVQSERLFVGVVENRAFFINFESEKHIIYDVKGLDIDLLSGMDEFSIDELIESFNYDDYSIVDGTIVCDGIVYKDFNKTEAGLPEGFDTYKSKETTSDAIGYTDIDENTCEISNFNLRFKSFTVPDTHNGKTVVRISADPIYIQKLTLGKNIEYLPNNTSVASYKHGMEITYLGTKEEWSKITNSSIWEKHDVKIICSDGETEK